MAKREFLQLAHNYNPKKHLICGMYLSEKLDGVRAFWDGGVTRGMPCSKVPFANTAKHERFQHPPISSGLWSRYGQPLRAPDWWLDTLPKIPMDGELYAGVGKFQTVTSIVRSHEKDSEWKQIRYAVFDSPSPYEIFADGQINNEHFKLRFNGVASWFCSQLDFPIMSFMKAQEFLRNHLPETLKETVYLHPQTKLPQSLPLAEKRLAELLETVIASGGEGVMLRTPMSMWHPERSHDLLKIKAVNDAEAVVTGYYWGEPTDLERSRTGIQTDKMLGYMGALEVNYNGKTFKLSGFEMSERIMESNYFPFNGDAKAEAHGIGVRNPGAKVRDCHNPKFPIGSKVTFKYRELTDEGLPKEARYWRKYDE